ncbi:aminotransferase class IV [bacterium]|nr:aminotransferase class IV [bacterium]
MGTSPLLVSINGRLAPANEPVATASDRGFLYGDGLFETLRSYDGRPCLLAEHLARLSASAAALRFGRAVDPRAVADDVERLLEANALRDAYIRVTLSRGPLLGVLELEPPARPTLVIVAQPVHPPDAAAYREGQRAIVATIRQNTHSPLPRHKTLNYLGNLLARTEARERGAHEAVLLNTRGEVAEAAASNIFLVLGGQLVTPSLDANILPGVTRGRVLAVARAMGAPVEERTVSPDELHRADEILLTNSIIEVMPVASVDGRPVGSGPPWQTAAMLREAYRRDIGLARE